FRIIRFPWQLSKVKVRRTLAEALRVWSEVTPLTFTEVYEGRADIVIDFTRYWHGDNLPFDGPGGILAHAFFPKTHREGDVHFDYDEAWTIGNSIGTDLLQVAAHEFGHVLGLQHSSVSKSLMSPFYSFRYPLSLSADDKQGIQYLYGAPHPPTTAPTPKPEDNQPEPESNEIPYSEVRRFLLSTSMHLPHCSSCVEAFHQIYPHPGHDLWISNTRKTVRYKAYILTIKISF
ncbi:unnamed protein product, partial [Staurois parvus]